MKTVKLYPTRRGLIVRDPHTRKPLSESGEMKPKTGYWLRRMREGSVSENPLAALPPAATQPEVLPAPLLPVQQDDKAATKSSRKSAETDK
jgi:hypothetical protein